MRPCPGRPQVQNLYPGRTEGKSFDEQKEIMLAWIPGITTKPMNAQVVLRPRT